MLVRAVINNLLRQTTSPKSKLVQFTSSSSSLLHNNNLTTIQTLQNTRSFWGWLNTIFNKYDASRVQEVGPDRAAAEWLIRCGAGVKWNQGSSDWFRDYNSLPAAYSRTLKITEVDATDSAVMSIGFKHFEGLTMCHKIIFHKASYLEDDALQQLGLYLQDCLKELEISSCGNITVDGLKSLTQLKNLEKLLLYDLPEIKNKQECIAFLSQGLPKCHISFPYAQASEKKKMKKSDEEDQSQDKK